jgi:HSP20 family protein
MSAKSLIKFDSRLPLAFDDFFKPWNELFDDSFPGVSMKVPAANIAEQKNEYLLSLATPGLKKRDFKIGLDGKLLTISCEKEESNEEKGKKFSRKEYNYSSFRRTFTLPEEINQEKIGAKYEDGVLKISLPRIEEPKNSIVKQILVG